MPLNAIFPCADYMADCELLLDGNFIYLKFFANPFDKGLFRRDLTVCNGLMHTGEVINVLTDIDLIGVREGLNPRSDVNRLPEVVDAVVKRDHDRVASMDSNLQDELVRDAVVENFDVMEHF